MDSIHRNIAEGFCRKSIKEYLNFLQIAKGSLGETVSGYIACYKAEQINQNDFDRFDSLAYKLENGLIKLIESLEYKKENKDWQDSYMVREENAIYGID